VTRVRYELAQVEGRPLAEVLAEVVGDPGRDPRQVVGDPGRAG
jgi:hypothetical protein